MFQGVRKSGWWRKAALIALLAVFQQALVFALMTPAQAFPDAASATFGLSSICGSAPVGDGSSHKSQGTPQDCQMCPLCQALVFAGLSLLPQAVSVPVRSAAIIYRAPLPAAHILSGAVTLAAQPRGPPADLTYA